jgi:hypothetical protein
MKKYSAKIKYNNVKGCRCIFFRCVFFCDMVWRYRFLFLHRTFKIVEIWKKKFVQNAEKWSKKQ